MDGTATATEKLRVEPFDEYNQRLVANVHPPGWTNPQPKDRYHLVAIGAGSGGLISSAGAAGIGAKSALIERHLLGGDCLNVGCVPSKGVISAARAWKVAAEAAEKFAGPSTSASGDFSKAMERMRRLRSEISPADSAERYTELGVDVFLGHGRFTGPDTLEVDGKTLNFRRAVIATGARAAAPPIPGLEDVGYLNNENIFTLTELPRRLLVIGAGPIGCEMAQSFARFGSDVTILDMADHILPREDADAAAVVQSAMTREGVSYEPRVKISSAERKGDERIIHFERDGKSESVTADQVLVAVGRAPNVEGLGLDEAGVKYERHGVIVDDYLRTSNSRIFAVGDICSKYKFTHMADAQARLVIENSLFFGPQLAEIFPWIAARKKVSHLVVPWCTYTSPEIAHVGYYETDAREAGFDVETIKIDLSDLDRAVLDGESEGFLKLHIAKGSRRLNGRILGGTLVAEHAGEMIGELALAVTAKLNVSAIGATIHPYPTQGEVYKRAADAWNRRRLTPGTKKFLQRFFKIFK